MKLTDRQLLQATASALWEEDVSVVALRLLWERAGYGSNPQPKFLDRVKDTIVAEIREDYADRGLAALDIDGMMLMDSIRDQIPYAAEAEQELVYSAVLAELMPLRRKVEF